jgi:hypothetical protein
MATWPATLPAPLAQGYGITPADPVVRTDFEVGAKRARRRTAARNDSVSVSWNFTDAEFQAFREWFEDDATGAAGGAAWFNVTLRLGNGGAAEEEARFAGVFKADATAAQRWLVSATLEVR